MSLCKLKDSEVFEIRKVVSEHFCSVDECRGYQAQATASVIGELMRWRLLWTEVQWDKVDDVW